MEDRGGRGEQQAGGEERREQFRAGETARGRPAEAARRPRGVVGEAAVDERIDHRSCRDRHRRRHGPQDGRPQPGLAEHQQVPQSQRLQVVRRRQRSLVAVLLVVVALLQPQTVSPATRVQVAVEVTIRLPEAIPIVAVPQEPSAVHQSLRQALSITDQVILSQLAVCSR